jgi:hypothetical protein
MDWRINSTSMKYNNKSSTDTGEIVNLFADFFKRYIATQGKTLTISKSSR